MLPKITIITPSYNQGYFLEQTIDSVLSQNYPHLEYMVIDGGSVDNSVEIIKKYEKYLAYWVSEKDKGQSDAINKGLQKATGDIVNWLNSDDYYEKNTLNIIGKSFENLQVHVVCGRSRIFYDEGNQTSHFSSGTDIYKNNLAKTIGWARIDQPETFFRASAIQKMGFVNDKFHYVMDKEWWIRYLLLFGLDNILQIEDVLVNFRLHGDSKTVSQQKGFQIETNSLFYELAEVKELHKQKEFLSNLSEIKEKINQDFYKLIDKSLIEKAIHYYLLYKADEYYYFGNKNSAKKCLKEIEESLLDNIDKKLFKELTQKVNIPTFLIKILRFLKSKMPQNT